MSHKECSPRWRAAPARAALWLLYLPLAFPAVVAADVPAAVAESGANGMVYHDADWPIVASAGVPAQLLGYSGLPAPDGSADWEYTVRLSPVSRLDCDYVAGHDHSNIGYGILRPIEDHFPILGVECSLDVPTTGSPLEGLVFVSFNLPGYCSNGPPGSIPHALLPCDGVFGGRILAERFYGIFDRQLPLGVGGSTSEPGLVGSWAWNVGDQTDNWDLIPQALLPTGEPSDAWWSHSNKDFRVDTEKASVYCHGDRAYLRGKVVDAFHPQLGECESANLVQDSINTLRLRARFPVGIDQIAPQYNSLTVWLSGTGLYALA